MVDHVHTTLYDQDWQWQPPISVAVKGLTAAQAARKPAPAQHSIWQIVRRLILESAECSRRGTVIRPTELSSLPMMGKK